VNTFINNYNNGINKSFIEEDGRIYRLEYIDRNSLTIDILALNLNDVAESLLLAKLGVISIRQERNGQVCPRIRESRDTIIIRRKYVGILRFKHYH